MKSKPVKIMLAAAGALLLLAGVFLLAGPGKAPGDGSQKLILEVMPGMGIQKVTETLAAENMLSNPAYFRWLVRWTGGGKIKAGVYELNNGMTAGRIASILTEGKVRMLSITIPEGYHNRQIAELLTEKKLVKSPDEFLKIAEDPEVLKKYNIPAKNTEGYLFPETYSVPYGYSAVRLHELMLKQFFARLKEAEPPANITPEELHRRVVLASIIEREAQKKDELPIMAQVFLNRLDQRMKLESCATIQYLFERPHKKLYERDLVIPSPYNTYIHKGMPPGPISNPGVAALRAAFHPTPTDNLFFVLKPDGSHHFSRTFKEHQAAKREFLDSQS